MVQTTAKKTKTNNCHEAIWDQHGSYQWTYFTDEVKHRIKFFLSQRLYGRNLDLGGGWHLLYPNSTVVDLSSVCLSHNPAKEKLQFDLDEIGKGRKLPYNDNSFDSATMVSVWQYLRYHKLIVKELSRVLKPGAELYVINGQDAGLEECIIATGNSKEIMHFFKRGGYDAILENIPLRPEETHHEFQSVCVAMPDFGLFGTIPSRVKGKRSRISSNRHSSYPEKFSRMYADWEMYTTNGLLSELMVFPVTRYSQKFLSRAEEFNNEYHEKTGGNTLMVLHSIPQRLAMLTEESENRFVPIVSYIGENAESESGYELTAPLREKYGIKGGTYVSYLGCNNLAELMRRLDEIESEKPPPSYEGRGSQIKRDRDIREYADFLSAIPLNSFTQDLQHRMYGILKQKTKDLDKRIKESVAFEIYMETVELEGRRGISDLVLLKEKLRKRDGNLVGWANFGFYEYIPHLRELIEKEDRPSYY